MTRGCISLIIKKNRERITATWFKFLRKHTRIFLYKKTKIPYQLPTKPPVEQVKDTLSNSSARISSQASNGGSSQVGRPHTSYDDSKLQLLLLLLDPASSQPSQLHFLNFVLPPPVVKGDLIIPRSKQDHAVRFCAKKKN